jgi:HSP20 family molecular chaperone IbpA
MAERVIAPDVCMFNDERCETLNIQIDLPGVNKGDIDFRFLEDGFFVIAKSEDVTFKGAFALPGPVDAEKAIGDYTNGMLTVNVPYKRSVTAGKRLTID